MEFPHYCQERECPGLEASVYVVYSKSPSSASCFEFEICFLIEVVLHMTTSSTFHSPNYFTTATKCTLRTTLSRECDKPSAMLVIQ